jgi:hypothetical protein
MCSHKVTTATARPAPTHPVPRGNEGKIRGGGLKLPLATVILAGFGALIGAYYAARNRDDLCDVDLACARGKHSNRICDVHREVEPLPSQVMRVSKYSSIGALAGLGAGVLWPTARRVGRIAGRVLFRHARGFITGTKSPQAYALLGLAVALPIAVMLGRSGSTGPQLQRRPAPDAAKT